MVEQQSERNLAIESLIDKAKDADKADDALKFSQAACNAANAINVMKHWPKETVPEPQQSE